MKRLLKLARNSRGKKLLLQTYIAMTLVRLGLLLLPFSRLSDWVSKSKQWTFLALAPQEVNIARIVHAVDRSGFYQPGKPMCLARALTTAALMNIYSFPYEIKIGVAKSEAGKFEAHAWVVAQNVVIMGNLPDLSRYALMSSKGDEVVI
ncbi:MAG: lasso peptide biosynthesis B2 protein [Cyanobacteria bacterium J06600_6]